MELEITTPVKLKDGDSYGFTVVLDKGAFIIPGFRVFQGKLTPPMRRSKAYWTPFMYAGKQQAVRLYWLVQSCLPADAVLIADTDKAIAGLLADEYVIGKLGLPA